MLNSNIFTSELNLPAHFVASKRVDALNFDPRSLSAFIREHCEIKGDPLVVANIDHLKKWNEQAFSLDQLKALRGETELIVSAQDNSTVKLDQFIDNLKAKYGLGGTPPSNNATILDNFYAKDIACPDEVKQAMTDALPQYLMPQSYSDLFSLLPERFQAENLMCYIGQTNTGTPIHRDLCGTMGHNIMVNTSPNSFAEWYIIKNDQRKELATILQPSSQDRKIHLIETTDEKIKKATGVTSNKSSFIESDRAWLDHSKLEGTNLQIQVIIQKKGDLVIVPSRAYHQVRNVGFSMKIAWNRITPDTLKYAFEDQIPLYRIINRPEVYKCKAIVAATIKEWYKQMLDAEDKLISRIGARPEMPPAFRSGVDEFVRNSKTLLNIYLNEVIAPELLYEEHNQKIITDGTGEVCTVVCDFCHTDIFHRYYHCSKCNEYDICLDCYSMGRSCKHVASMKMHQSPDDIMTHVQLYRNYVKSFNEKFAAVFGQVQPHLEEDILNVSKENAKNLATVCRRLEKYRIAKPHSFNSLQCSHCSKRSTVSKMNDQGYSLWSIFSRDVCPSVSLPWDTNKIRKLYTCPDCTKTCESCKPLVNKKSPLENYDLVYYLHPAHDPRNYGCYIDVNMLRTSDFPWKKSRETDKAVETASTTEACPVSKSTPVNENVTLVKNTAATEAVPALKPTRITKAARAVKTSCSSKPTRTAKTTRSTKASRATTGALNANEVPDVSAAYDVNTVSDVSGSPDADVDSGDYKNSAVDSTPAASTSSATKIILTFKTFRPVVATPSASTASDVNTTPKVTVSSGADVASSRTTRSVRAVRRTKAARTVNAGSEVNAAPTLNAVCNAKTTSIVNPVVAVEDVSTTRTLRSFVNNHTVQFAHAVNVTSGSHPAPNVDAIPDVDAASHGMVLRKRKRVNYHVLAEYGEINELGVGLLSDIGDDNYTPLQQKKRKAAINKPVSRKRKERDSDSVDQMESHPRKR